MNIKFKLNNENEVLVIAYNKITNEEKEVGHIFTPGGTLRDNKSTIQVCGFKEAMNLWGCGIYGDSNNRRLARKDIELIYEWNTQQISNDGCGGCYSNPCVCENKEKGKCPFNVKHESEIILGAL